MNVYDSLININIIHVRPEHLCETKSAQSVHTPMEDIYMNRTESSNNNNKKEKQSAKVLARLGSSKNQHSFGRHLH